MGKVSQNIRYEELYNRLLERGMALHASNQKRIRIGLIFLGVFTVLMILIRLLTNSDRVVFMIIWVIGMFAISIYLISIEYIDNSVRKTLEEVTERETGFEKLLPDSEEMREMVHSRIQERHDDLQSQIERLRSEERERRENRTGKEEDPEDDSADGEAGKAEESEGE